MTDAGVSSGGQRWRRVGMMVLTAAIGVLAPRLAAQSGDLPADFEARAHQVWLSAPASSVAESIATLAGLRFQAVADRRTPDLDSALARAVMAGGRLRDSPWGWLALGHRLTQRYHCAPLDHVPVATWSRCRRAAVAYRAALERRAGFAPAVVELHHLIPWPALFAEPEEELATLTAALADGQLSAAHRATVSRVITLLHASRGDVAALDSALTADGERYFTAGEVAYLRARQFGFAGQGEAALAAYRAAASDAGPGKQADWIRRDLHLIGAPGDAARWDSLPPAARGPWIEAFWSDRDFAAGRARGARLVEHARRWQRAFADYRWYRGDDRLRQPTSPRYRPGAASCGGEFAVDTLGAAVAGCTMPAAARDTMTEFDARGLTYLRHGEPQWRANYPGMQQFSSAAWLYVTDSGSLVIHFRGSLNMGMHASAVATGDWMTACQVIPRYCVMAARREMGQRIPPEETRRVAARGARDIQTLLTTDGAPQRFGEALAVNLGAYGLGHVPSRLTLVADLPLAALRPLASPTGSVALRWQIRLRDAAGAWVVSRDTVERVALPGSAADDAYLTLIREVAVGPGRYDLRLVLSDSAGRAGSLYARDGIVMVSGAAVAPPGLSDLVLLPDGEVGGGWQIEGTEVHLSPTFTPGGAAYLRVGYLLTGVAGAAVPVRVSVVPAEEAAAPAVAVAFVEHPTTARAFRVQRVGVAELARGAYDLVVAATLPDGQVVERRQRLVVR